MDDKLTTEGAWFEQSATVGALAKALAAAQGEMENALKDSDNPFFKSKYADLATIVDTCKGPLSKHGIARYQAVVTARGIPGVRTQLIHESGEWVAATAFCEPKDGGPQALGSVITYLRRYSLAAAVGVAQDDDDGEAGVGRAKKPARASATQMDAARRREEAVAVHDQEMTMKAKAAHDREVMLMKARHIIGEELKWDVKTSALWLAEHTGKGKLAQLDANQLTAVIHLLTLYGDEKDYPKALEDYRQRGLILQPEARAS
jgi:hypothetical protein